MRVFMKINGTKMTQKPQTNTKYNCIFCSQFENIDLRKFVLFA